MKCLCLNELFFQTMSFCLNILNKFKKKTHAYWTWKNKGIYPAHGFILSNFIQCWIISDYRLGIIKSFPWSSPGVNGTNFTEFMCILKCHCFNHCFKNFLGSTLFTSIGVFWLNFSFHSHILQTSDCLDCSRLKLYQRNVQSEWYRCHHQVAYLINSKDNFHIIIDDKSPGDDDWI